MRSIRIAVPSLRRKRSTDREPCLAPGNNRSGCRTDSGPPQPQGPYRGSSPPGRPEPTSPGVRPASLRICQFCDLAIEPLQDHLNEQIDKSLNEKFWSWHPEVHELRRSTPDHRQQIQIG